MKGTRLGMWLRLLPVFIDSKTGKKKKNVGRKRKVGGNDSA